MKTAEVYLNGVELTVKYDYYPPSKGSRDSYGVPLEPDEDEYVEVDSIQAGGCEIIDLLSGDQISQVAGLVLACLSDN